MASSCEILLEVEHFFELDFVKITETILYL